MFLVSGLCLDFSCITESIVIPTYSDLNAFIIRFTYQEKKMWVILVKWISFYYINIL